MRVPWSERGDFDRQLTHWKLDDMSQDDLVTALLSQLWSSERFPREEAHRNAEWIWSLYRRFNLRSKQTLTLPTLRRLLLAVARHDASIILRNETHRGDKVVSQQRTAARWGTRMATILRDMRFVGGLDIDQWKAFDAAMGQLARYGDVRQVEQIVHELALRPGHRDQKQILIHRLTAISVQLRNLASTPRPKGQWAATEPDEACTSALWALLRDLRDDTTTLEPLSARLMIICVNLLRSHKVDEAISSRLDRLLKQLFTEVYKLDLNNFSIKEDVPAYFNRDAVNALLGYLGRKGELWRMVSAFETFANPKQAETDLPAVEETGAEIPASLRSQMRQVPSYILSSFRSLDWTALRITPATRADSSESIDFLPATEGAIGSGSLEAKRSYNDYHPSPPMPFDIVETFQSTRPIASEPTPSIPWTSSSGQGFPQGWTAPVLVNNLMYQTMLRCAAEQRDLDVAMYLVRSAHTASAETQGEWIRSVLTAQSPSWETNADIRAERSKVVAADGEAQPAEESNENDVRTTTFAMRGTTYEDDFDDDATDLAKPPVGDETTMEGVSSHSVPAAIVTSGLRKAIHLGNSADSRARASVVEYSNEDDFNTEETTGTPSSSDANDVSSLDDLNPSLDKVPAYPGRYDSLRRPRLNFSPWLLDVAYWLLRQEYQAGRRQGPRFKALKHIMEDAAERLRQEIKVLYRWGDGASSDGPADGAPPLRHVRNHFIPPFAGYTSRSRRSPDALVRQAFDPAEYLRDIETTHVHISALLVESQGHRNNDVVRRRRQKKIWAIRQYERDGAVRSLKGPDHPVPALTSSSTSEPRSNETGGSEGKEDNEWIWKDGLIVRR